MRRLQEGSRRQRQAARVDRLASACRLAEEGAEVVLADLNRDGADSAAAEIQGASAELLDVTSDADWQRVADAVAARHGRVDILGEQRRHRRLRLDRGRQPEDWRHDGGQPRRHLFGLPAWDQVMKATGTAARS